VRLASKLIGWNVDIKSEEEKRQEIEAQMAALTAPELRSPNSRRWTQDDRTHRNARRHHDRKLADMTPEQLTEIPGIGEKMVEKISCPVAAYFQSLENPRRKRNLSRSRGARVRGRGVEEAVATEEAVEAADVAAEEIEAPAEAEEIAAAAAAAAEGETERGIR